MKKKNLSLLRLYELFSLFGFLIIIVIAILRKVCLIPINIGEEVLTVILLFITFGLISLVCDLGGLYESNS